MSPGQGLAGHFHGGARLPGGDDVEHPRGVSALGPQRQHRTSNLAGAVRCIVLEIDGSAGAVIFTARVDGARIFEAAQVFSISLRWYGLRNQCGEAAAQEDLSAVANERLL